MPPASSSSAGNTPWYTAARPLPRRCSNYRPRRRCIPTGSAWSWLRTWGRAGVGVGGARHLAGRVRVATTPADDPFARIVRLVCADLERPLPPWRIEVSSEIPIASGLGSGAAIAAATARGLLAAFGVTLPVERLSALVYEVEKLHHGTPSGIDNTVVVYGRPVWFVRGQAPEPFASGAALHLLIGDTGIASPTRLAVGDVRRGWEAYRDRYEALFDSVSNIVTDARTCIEAGDSAGLGKLLDQNQALLDEMGVSSPELDRLVAAARGAGALGAKLSGGGRGGNMIALVGPGSEEAVREALLAAGAKRVMGAELAVEAA